MKITFSARIMVRVMESAVRTELGDRKKEIRTETMHILRRAKEIGNPNRLLGSYVMAAYFIAMNRCTDRTEQELGDILERGMANSRLYRAFMGNADSYFSEKNMKSRRAWSAQTHLHRYPNDWEVDVLEKTPEYEFGFDYTQCGVCKLCRDEGCPQLAKYLCRLDFMTTEMMGIRLQRTQTLAEGGDRCDFRFSRLPKEQK